MGKRRLFARIVLVVILSTGCEEPWPGSACFEMNLDRVPLGAGILDTWRQVDRSGWECRVQPSVYAQQVGLRCVHGAGSTTSMLALGFVRDALVKAELTRTPGGPDGRCRDEASNLDVWADAELQKLVARYGAPDRSDGKNGTPHSYVWSATQESITLTIDPDRGTLSISGTDRESMRALRLSAAEHAHLIDLVRGGIRPATTAAEIAWNLRAIATAEQSYYSEFGHYLPAGPYPRENPGGEYVEWQPDEADGFAELGFSPAVGRVSCSYGVGVGPAPCERERCQTFTAAAVCDPKKDGRLVYWGLVSANGQATADGPFGVCRQIGVYSPDSGDLIGHNVVGLCEAPRRAGN